MRKLLSALGLVAGLLISSPALAAGTGVTWVYDSGNVAAGAAIDSGVRVTGAPDSIACFVNNADAGATRAFTASFISDDGSTVLFSPAAVTVAVSTKAALVIAPGATANSATAVSAKPTRRMRFQLAAGGSSVGRITCIGG